MRYFLGCDVCKTKIDVSLIDEQGTELWYDKVPNDHASLAEFLLALAGNYPDDVLTCVVESTGTYHQPLTEAAYAVGIACKVYNPILTKQYVKATIRGTKTEQYVKATIRGTKTDRTDATVIARLGLRGEGRLYTPEPYKTTKYYARGAQQLSILDSSFRQYKQHFTEVLDGQLTAEANEVLEGVRVAIKEAKAQIYKDTAVSAQGKNFRLLQTIPGVGPFIASSLIGEIQTIERFKTAKALIAYAGLDPKIKQSGHTLNSTGKLTKRGSPHLRRNLFIAANVTRQHDPNFKALYDKKRSEGKSYTVATVVVARKLLAIVRAVWLTGKPYDVDFFTKEK